MEKKLIVRGVLAGLLAGVVAFVFARIFAEGPISDAIDYENGRDAAQAALDKAAGLTSAPEAHELFSRTVQANVGIGVGIIGFGAAMGALFAVCYTICLGRVGNLSARSLALLVALAGFLGIYFVPFLKYPANPPGIGESDTIRQRGFLYLLMVFASIVLLALAVWLGRRLTTRFGTWNASLLAGGAFIVAVGVVMIALASSGQVGSDAELFGRHATETPRPLTDANGSVVYPGFPADVLYNFRLYSVAAQVLLWAVIGLVFAPMAGRLLDPAMQPVRRVKATPQR